MKAAPIISFIVGLGIGGVAGWYISKSKAEETKNEEIAESNEAFKRRIKELEAALDERKKEIAAEHSPKQAPKDIYEERVAKIKATAAKYRASEEDDAIEVEQIPAEEYGSMDPSEWSEYSLIYYKGDDTLVDEDGDEVVDPSTFVGDFDLAGYFAQHDDDDMIDSVYFRSNMNRSDYEIVLSERCFHEEDDE